ncbi:hypothetical protein AVEN_271011-1 [Araneus ventricosus]|uniref:RNase H type-1 domain-containing protein n=1 Tax=Araneus ventricosus TaxID=182803 RepID=A0A4Y2XAW8_ARAVE|nr:hypothetical protein AVEN_271011-1 [Araneus ventricosus]
MTEDNHIFTDGSKIENRVGAAFVHHVNKQEITKSQYRLADHNTVYIESLSDNREFIWQIKKRLKDREDIKLMWVRAHKGEMGNERANLLAKGACSRDLIDVQFTYLKVQIRNINNEKINRKLTVQMDAF